MKHDDAVSEILSLLFITGVVLVVFAILLAAAVPGYVTEKESEQLLYLEDEFSSLKTGIDFLWLTETYDTEKTVFFSLSADHAVSGKLDAGSLPLEITADEGVFSLPLLVITYSKDNMLQYRYLGGALYKEGTKLISASESAMNTVLICTDSNPFSLYAAKHAPVVFSLERKEEYHHASYDGKYTNLLTVFFVRIDGGIT